MINMFDNDRSATRGKMSPRGIYAFSHSDAFGNAPASRLTETIQPRLIEPGRPARSFADYQVDRPIEPPADGITFTVIYE
jgi:CRISPR-associated protein Csd2